MSLKDLASQTRLDKGQISRVVTELTSKGLVERRRSGRGVSLRLTPAGLERHKKILLLAKEHDLEYTEGLTVDEHVWLRDSLDTLIANVAEASDSDRVD